MPPATATATATATTATTTTTTATTPTATPSLFQQLWKQCKGLLSVFSPCGSLALSEELSVGLDVVAAASTETLPEIQQSAGVNELTKIDSGVQVIMPVEKPTAPSKEIQPRLANLHTHCARWSTPWPHCLHSGWQY
ncbi:hypothetical protein BASA60_001251 [Batrachochytrium salamandrivorans]|nr:hypothetical protein BASA60_001251 [Batrachochytrium salamandrivorans]